MNLSRYIDNLKPNNSSFSSADKQNIFLQGFNVCLNSIKRVAPLSKCYIVGVTGKTGAGKTTAVKKIAGNGDFFACRGRDGDFKYRIDADVVYHDMLKHNEIPEIKEQFGKAVLDDKGRVDTKMLAPIVFSSIDMLEKFNDIVLPVISEKIISIMCEIAKDNPTSVFILDAPTLIESGLYNICDEIIFVKADKDKRKKRIMKRDGLTEQQADARMRFEKPDSYYESFADKIVEGV